MKIDPALIKLHAETIGAVFVRPGAAKPAAAPAAKLDSSLIRKIQQKVPIFKNMPLDCLMNTLKLADYLPVKAGDVVFSEGDFGDSFFVLVAGEVVVEKLLRNKVCELARLGVADCFGEMSIVGHELRTATVRAAVDSTCMRLYRESVDHYPDSAAHIYRNIALILASRLKDSSIRLAKLATEKA
jgi:CRP-like cAMP-binding protein